MLNIYLHYGNCSPLMITLSTHDPVSALEEYLPDDGPHAFYHGEFKINPAFTLAYLGISSEDHIFAVQNETERKKKSSPRKKQMVDAQRQIDDRLNDQFYNHIEGTTMSFRRLISRFCRSKLRDDNRRDKRSKHKTKIPKKGDNPATDACPMPW